jgi:hypothetical protein
VDCAAVAVVASCGVGLLHVLLDHHRRLVHDHSRLVESLGHVVADAGGRWGDYVYYGLHDQGLFDTLPVQNAARKTEKGEC